MDHKLLKEQAEYNKKEQITKKQNRERDFFADFISGKMKTSMIRSLAEFEKQFEYLWGGKDGPYTKEQKMFKEKWKNVRTSILDFGNNNIREVLDEIYAHIIYLETVTTTYINKE